uniref:Methyltransferase n=1 Tax=viral metagenome TaxID=1070528 RepID=A0A6C0DDW2_9ZZZZ
MTSWSNRSSYRKNTSVIIPYTSPVSSPVSPPISLSTFQGKYYRLASNWYSFLPVESYQSKPIQYLEIGAFYGANLLSVAQTYCIHPDSRMYVIDPWIDYEEYPEYKGQQKTIYDTFITNIDQSGHSDKIIVKRGYSNEQLLLLEDNSFDVIYIDGNHEPEYVLEDAVLSFRKLKIDGIMIFDDYGWGGPDLTQKGIDAFLSGYHKRIQHIGMKDSQVFIRKMK